MPQSTFLGHPVHPQLIAVPSALLPFTFVMDLLFRMAEGLAALERAMPARGPAAAWSAEH